MLSPLAGVVFLGLLSGLFSFSFLLKLNYDESWCGLFSVDPVRGSRILNLQVSAVSALGPRSVPALCHLLPPCPRVTHDRQDHPGL